MGLSATAEPVAGPITSEIEWPTRARIQEQGRRFRDTDARAEDDEELEGQGEAAIGSRSSTATNKMVATMQMLKT